MESMITSGGGTAASEAGAAADVAGACPPNSAARPDSDLSGTPKPARLVLRPFAGVRIRGAVAR